MFHYRFDILQQISLEMGFLFLQVVMTMAGWRSWGMIIHCMDTAWQACRTSTT